MNEADQLKRAAARAAMAHLRPNRIVGVGSGSTVAYFIDALAERAAEFPRAVSSSLRSTELLRERGIEVVDLNDAGAIDVYVDGADEVDPGLALIKGGGGALTREKILAEASRLFVCIVDASKEVGVLGRFPLPVEVIPMARELVATRLAHLDATPVLREAFVTDNGNQILDASGLEITDPEQLEREINQWPGVVTVGLFARRRADLLLVAHPDGIRTRAAKL